MPLTKEGILDDLKPPKGEEETVSPTSFACEFRPPKGEVEIATSRRSSEFKPPKGEVEIAPTHARRRRFDFDAFAQFDETGTVFRIFFRTVSRLVFSSFVAERPNDFDADDTIPTMVVDCESAPYVGAPNCVADSYNYTIRPGNDQIFFRRRGVIMPTNATRFQSWPLSYT